MVVRITVDILRAVCEGGIHMHTHTLIHTCGIPVVTNLPIMWWKVEEHPKSPKETHMDMDTGRTCKLEMNTNLSSGSNQGTESV